MLLRSRDWLVAKWRLPLGYIQLHKPNKDVIRTTRISPLISIHVFALLITVVALYLGASQVVFADANASSINAKLNAMQFVARIYEFVLSMSLAHIVLDHVRYEMLSNTGISFGHCIAAFQLGSPQYLLSEAYWIPTWKSLKAIKPWQIWTSVLVLASISMTALVGPSSAVILVPQLHWSPVKDPFTNSVGTTFLPGIYDTLYPSHIDSTWIPSFCIPSLAQDNPYCPNMHAAAMGSWASSFFTYRQPPNFTFPSTLTSYRTIAASPAFGTPPGLAQATAVTYDMSRYLGNIWLYVTRVGYNLGYTQRPRVSIQFKDGKPAMSPFVQVQCSAPIPIRNESTIELSFSADAIVPGAGFSAFSPVPRNLTVQTKDWTSRNHAQVRFVSLPNSPGGENVLGVIVGFSFINFNTLNLSENVRVLFGCTVDARWIHADLSFEPRSTNIVVSANSNPESFGTDVYETSQHVNLDVSFANTLNSVLVDYQLNNNSYTLFEYPMRYFYFNEDAMTNWFDYADHYRWVFGTCVALQLTEALSSVRIDRGPLVWIANEVPPRVWDITAHNAWDEQRHYYNQTDYLFNSPEYARTRPDLFTEITWITERLVYAWSFQETPAYLSLVIIALHVCFIIYYLCTSLLWRRKSNGWGEFLEFLTLALQSHPSPHLEGSRTKIENASVYAEPTRIIGDLSGNDVELVVGTDDSISMKVLTDEPQQHGVDGEDPDNPQSKQHRTSP